MAADCANLLYKRAWQVAFDWPAEKAERLRGVVCPDRRQGDRL